MKYIFELMIFILLFVGIIGFELSKVISLNEFMISITIIATIFGCGWILRLSK